MAKIQVLSPHVADLIAAGEVVERPASVIKELMENSIDAGASSVTVEINGGGMTFMRVTDNGCGMSLEDAKTAFLRHATSKLRDEHGLEAIGTLGFRGEALAAISSVSHIELLTREIGSQEGVSLTIEAGNVTSSSPAGCPEGTTIIVRNLFYNTPARLKFMKTDRAEASGVSAAVLRTALSHPEVAVRYIKDGKEELRSPGDGRMDSVIYSIFGRDFARGMLRAETSDNEITVKGYVSTPAACRGNRSNQFFFVNGRHVKSKTLQAALEQAYKNSLFTGRYPSCILYITMSTALVDVNVHPAKTEVRFLKERQVFDGVYYAALSALQSEGPGSAEVKLPEEDKKILTQPAEAKRYIPGTPKPADTPKASVKPSDGFFRTIPAEQYRSTISGGFKSSIPTVRESGSASTVRDFSRISYSAGTTDKKPADFPASVKNQSAGDGLNTPVQKSPPALREHQPILGEPEPVQQQIQNMPEEMSYRYIGEALNTYLIVESGSSMWLIDKHAAHERINFDRLKSSGYSPMVQPLLVPIVCKIGVPDTQLLMDSTDILSRFGIDVEPFGDDTVAVRQLPSDIEQNEIQALLEQLCDDIRAGSRGDENARTDNIMHTMACKAAIKAGKRTEPEQLDGLIRAVLSGQVRYCPHGRPVAVEMTKSALDKSFKRTL